MDAEHESRLAEVGCALGFAVDDHAVLAVQVAVATTAGEVELEELLVAIDGEPLEAEEVVIEHGGRVHLVRCGAGQLTCTYRAVVRQATPAGAVAGEAERLLALRQSRYCPSDALEAFAEAELGGMPDGPARGRLVGDWVHRRLRYQLGSSSSLDTAVDTLLAGRGVCRDFAHLTVALCRAAGIPARLAAVYAPGLWPMDFHAVAEVVADDRWEVVDATRLAPRQSLVRIATGRDAADTAFATTLSGSAELRWASVTAVTVGDLPFDDHGDGVVLA